MKLIAKALLESQKKIQNASKDAKNPHFKNTYATLESVLDAVKEAANGQGIVILQTAGKDSEGHFVDTTLLHESGESVSSKVYLVLDKQNMQGLGSAITYGRRYSLAGLFAIGQDDDDGNHASQSYKPAHNVTMPSSKPVVVAKPIAAPQVSINAEFDKPETYQAQVTVKNETYTHPAARDIKAIDRYVIPFGTKFKGKKLSEVDQNELVSYVNWIKESASNSGKTMTQDVADFIFMVDEYISTR